MAKKQKVKNPVGRPTVFTPEVIQKLDYAWSNNFTDRQAARYAGISPSAIVGKCKDDPSFCEHRQLIKEELSIRAKINIGKDIRDGDSNRSAWYLERAEKETYSTKVENKVTGNMDVSTTIEDKEAIMRKALELATGEKDV